MVWFFLAFFANGQVGRLLYRGCSFSMNCFIQLVICSVFWVIRFPFFWGLFYCTFVGV